ncbi:MAG: hypothetical protein CL583_06920 [Alteromonadaceae bacterium]|nr:hypothetical protein [Alteromonadaceae bacterium]|tara:strand:+ start:606 stop:2006 length:1401 start_codon:yes stop_codon:yes gene_type:complete
MSMERNRIRKFGLQLTAGAVSAFLLVPAAVAQSNSSAGTQLEQGPAVEHRQLDKNGDQILQWNELKPRLESADLGQDWDQDRIMQEFDQNNDAGLGPLEYQMFLANVGNDSPGSQTAQGGQSQNTQVNRGQEIGGEQEVVVQSQQPKVKVDTDPAQVQVQQRQPEVAVDQKSPKVRVDPSDPQVTVDQKQPKIKVTQPEPKVQVTVPKPEVEVVQREPDVNVEKDKPQVEVEQRRPDVEVSQQEPKVNVNQSDPEVAVVPAKPQVSITEESQQANVDVNQADKAQVEVQKAEPEVQVGSSDANVNVQSTDQADVEIQREQQQARNDSQRADEEDVNQLPATAAGMSSREQQESRAQTEDLDTLPVEELDGRNVQNSNGENLGKVDLIVLEKDGNTPAVVLTSGGILGFGSSKVLVPLEELTMNQGQLVWQTSKTANEMKQSDYNEQKYTEVSPENYNVVGDLKQAQ